MFDRPTLSELQERIAADLRAGMSPDDLLRRRDDAVLGSVLAGASHALHGHIEWLFRQNFADLADASELPRIGALWSIYPTPAAAATGAVLLTGAVGAVVPLSARLRRVDGVLFQPVAETTLTASPMSMAVRAVDPGQSGNTAAGSTLGFDSPVLGVQSTATVAGGGLSGGADPEQAEALRARILERMRQPPQGGCAYDYVAWAKQVPGVTRAWVLPQQTGPGTVTIMFVRDLDASGVIPDAGEVAAVQSYIDQRRPVTAQATVIAPTPVPVNFTIAVTPATAAVKAAIVAELQDLLQREAEPGKTLYLSRINEAISLAAGEFDHQLTVPAANLTYSTVQMPVMGGVTWV